jgi:hypothetical protein
MAENLSGPDTDLPRSPHSDKFRVVLAGLIGLALGALAVAAAVIVAHDDNSSPTVAAQSSSILKWSTWKPSDTGNAGAAEIADYIAPFYRLSTSQQLGVITPISVTQLNETTGSFTGDGLTVALNTATGGTTSVSDLRPLTGETVAYDICGQGSSTCAVGGTPSTARELLLRREALELALYTFEYLPKAQNVAVVLPPGHTTASAKSKSVTVAVLFVRAQLKPLLNEPINETLQTYPPDMAQLKTWKQTEEAGLVDEITSRNLFSEKVEAQQDGGNLLVLDPLPAQ